MVNEMRYRVFNRCKFNIGVTLINGLQIVIRPGSFQILTDNDILYIESICAKKKFFSQRMLVAYDMQGNEVQLENIGVYVDEAAPKHYSDDEIKEILKGSSKKIESWIAEIDDEVELHSIYEVAKSMDLTSSKLKLLSSKMPEKDMI